PRLCWSYALTCEVTRRSVLPRTRASSCDCTQPEMPSIDNGRAFVACAGQGTRTLSTSRSREEKPKRPPVTLVPTRAHSAYGHGGSRRLGTISAFSSPDVRVDAAVDV